MLSTSVNSPDSVGGWSCPPQNTAIILPLLRVPLEQPMLCLHLKPPRADA